MAFRLLAGSQTLEGEDPEKCVNDEDLTKRTLTTRKYRKNGEAKTILLFCNDNDMIIMARQQQY